MPVSSVGATHCGCPIVDRLRRRSASQVPGRHGGLPLRGDRATGGNVKSDAPRAHARSAYRLARGGHAQQPAASILVERFRPARRGNPLWLPDCGSFETASRMPDPGQARGPAPTGGSRDGWQPQVQRTWRRGRALQRGGILVCSGHLPGRANERRTLAVCHRSLG